MHISKGDLVLVLNNEAPDTKASDGRRYSEYKIPDKWVGTVLVVAGFPLSNDTYPPLTLSHPTDAAYTETALCWAWYHNIELVSTK